MNNWKRKVILVFCYQKPSYRVDTGCTPTPPPPPPTRQGVLYGFQHITHGWDHQD